VECWHASDYRNFLGVSILLISIASIFSVIYIAFPYIFQTRFLDALFIIGVGFGCGLPSLLKVKQDRTLREEIPKDSRIGQRLDEYVEYRDY